MTSELMPVLERALDEAGSVLLKHYGRLERIAIVPSRGQALQAFAGGTQRPGLPPGPPGTGVVPPITIPTTQYLYDVGGYFR